HAPPAQQVGQPPLGPLLLAEGGPLQELADPAHDLRRRGTVLERDEEGAFGEQAGARPPVGGVAGQGGLANAGRAVQPDGAAAAGPGSTTGPRRWTARSSRCKYQPRPWKPARGGGGKPAGSLGAGRGCFGGRRGISTGSSPPW